MFKFKRFYLRTGLSWRLYLQGVQRDVEWLGLPYPPGRHLRRDPYRESLGSLRAYCYNPHIITTSQSYCSLCMPKARGGMLRIVSYDSLVNTGTMERQGGQSAITPFDIRNGVIRTENGLSHRTPLNHFYSYTFCISSPQQHQLS